MADKHKLSKQGVRPLSAMAGYHGTDETSPMENKYMPMTTNDIRVLALLAGLGPDHLSKPDSELLALVYHECAHLYVQGHFKAFYDSLPNDLAINFMIDKRTLNWMLDNRCHFMVATANKPTLADRLERGANADIWTDYADGCFVTSVLIDDTQAAMLEAAKLLRKHGLDK